MPHCFPHIARRALLRFLLTILLTGSAAPLFAQVTLKTPSNLHEVVEYDAATKLSPFEVGQNSLSCDAKLPFI
ncbi:MAG: hypothetical protein LBN06_10260 [Prevotellaceae bacterium]|jgi:hypothetical protein|nr:hypothetical protein [Prevotellaceae bacterium]